MITTKEKYDYALPVHFSDPTGGIWPASIRDRGQTHFGSHSLCAQHCVSGSHAIQHTHAQDGNAIRNRWVWAFVTARLLRFRFSRFSIYIADRLECECLLTISRRFVVPSSSSSSSCSLNWTVNFGTTSFTLLLMLEISLHALFEWMGKKFPNFQS